MNTKTKAYMLFLFSLVPAFYSCQTADSIKRTTANQIILDEEYGKSKVVVMKEVATYEFIPLETTDKALLDKDYMVRHVDNDNIIITNNGRCEVFFFSRTGKFKGGFACKGSSDAEMRARITGCFWDAQKKEQYLNDLPNYGRIRVYNEKGNHLRTLRINTQYEVGAYITDYDKNTFLGYDDKNMYTQEAHVQAKANPCPYVLFSKTDGKKVGELPFRIPKRATGTHYQEITKSHSVILTIPGLSPYKRYGDEFIICDLALDTIYKYSPKTGVKTPLFSKLPELQIQEYPQTLVSLMDYNDKYVYIRRFVNYYSFETNKGGSREHILYDQQKKTFLRKQYAMGIGTYAPSVNEIGSPTLPKNTDCLQINTENIFKSLEKGDIKDPELKRIASVMKEDDNGVLVLVHYDK